MLAIAVLCMALRFRNGVMVMRRVTCLRVMSMRLFAADAQRELQRITARAKSANRLEMR
jgi:hypothetical protein